MKRYWQNYAAEDMIVAEREVVDDEDEQRSNRSVDDEDEQRNNTSVEDENYI